MPGGAAGAIGLNGRWQDSECIAVNGPLGGTPLYVKRHYQFDDSRRSWQLDASVYNSAACPPSGRLFTYHGAGSFVVGGKSPVAGNVYEATFNFDRWSATPETRDGVLALLNGRCGSGDFEQSRPLNLSVTGCSMLGIRPIAQAPRQTELVSVGNGRVFLGSGSFLPGVGDDRRAQLGSYGLVRTP